MFHYITVFCFLYLDYVRCGIVNNRLLFNVDTKVTFSPPTPAEYFGYSVFLTDTDNKLIVGAPKANSTGSPIVKSGQVFTCSIQNDPSSHNSTCKQLNPRNDRGFGSSTFLRKDMLFGATVGAIKNKIIFACAPSWAEPYRDTHLLTIGACYVFTTTRRNQVLKPLGGKEKQAITSPGSRKVYEDYGGKYLNYYAYGLAGLSMKVTDDSNVLLGAPGILQNTGYSVDSAMFEPHGRFLQVGGAPRSQMGLGQVLIIEPVITESNPIKIKAKLVGPQVGSYFGATLCCVDINGDDRIDLLVGAPNYVKQNGGFKYDQGAVFSYLNREKNSTFNLEESTHVLGNEASKARFGSAIASLGDIDGDGFNDVAIGAPWEDSGVVYIYQGSKEGLKRNYIQRITAEGSSGFGISISKGHIDNNYCNDVAIGAYASGTAYLYKCTPTIKVEASIKMQDIADLPENPTNFTAYFCLSVRPQVNHHAKLDIQAIKTIDPDLKRASILEDTSNIITLSPGKEMCDEHVVMVNVTSDLTKPIPISYELKLVTSQDTARLAEDSVLQASSLFQMMYDCGKDMICTPLLNLTLEPFNSPYVPGSDQKLGVKVTITNHEEPAYGIKFNLTLPQAPKRVPTSCILHDFNMTCSLPALFRRNDTAIFDIELEYEYISTYTDMVVTVEMIYGSNVTVKELLLKVHPVANISVTGKALPNMTVQVSRDTLYGAGNVSFVHYYQISNFGPSNWFNLKAVLRRPDKINLSSPVAGCAERQASPYMDCQWNIRAKHTISVVVPLRIDLHIFGDFLLENVTYNATSEMHILSFEKFSSVRTTLVLDPAPPLWPLIVAVVSGILLLALIMFVLYKFGFFSRPQKEDLKRLLEDKNTEQEQSLSDLVNTSALEGSSASTAGTAAECGACAFTDGQDDSTQFDASTLEFDASTFELNASQELIELDTD
ncbi:integrin alpha-PS5-like isoform X2 [Plodia interpunctella]|uniref:integrin alpha-PS5-like isoform X2 n=1 Tax=Plodia interpunctella TaxID=58824 RepID=UPI00236776A4|nr:integrin alpha-PS5-like isoform X2 [Plodia interpunctella]